MSYKVTSQVRKWKLEITVKDDGEASFTVDGGHLVGSCESAREGAALIRTALKMWKELSSSLPPDLQVWCRPSFEDGRYSDRVYIYEKIGFHLDEETGSMWLKQRLTPTKWARTQRKRTDYFQYDQYEGEDDFIDVEQDE